MRKTFVLASLMLALLTLTALMPVVKAATYYWDGVRFVEGELSPGHYIKYPHKKVGFAGDISTLGENRDFHSIFTVFTRFRVLLTLSEV